MSCCAAQYPGAKTTCVWLASGCAGCDPIRAVRIDTMAASGSVTTTYVSAADCTTPIVGATRAQEMSAGAPQNVYVVNQTPPPVVEYDREKSLLCTPTGQKVWAVTIWPEAAAPGTLPVMEFYDALTGALFGGVTKTLTTCADEQTDLSSAEWFCTTITRASISRVTAWNVTTNPPTVSATLWQDETGAVIANPAIGTFTVGACSLPDTCDTITNPILITNFTQLR